MIEYNKLETGESVYRVNKDDDNLQHYTIGEEVATNEGSIKCSRYFQLLKNGVYVDQLAPMIQQHFFYNAVDAIDQAIDDRAESINTFKSEIRKLESSMEYIKSNKAKASAKEVVKLYDEHQHKLYLKMRWFNPKINGFEYANEADYKNKIERHFANILLAGVDLCTGILDRNDNEIYENDIVEFENEQGIVELYVVYRSVRGFILINTESNNVYIDQNKWTINANLKVIGNTHK